MLQIINSGYRFEETKQCTTLTTMAAILYGKNITACRTNNIRQKHELTISSPESQVYKNPAYNWIDDVMFKRDSTGPLTKEETEYLAQIRSGMRCQQEYYDYHGINKKATPPFDEDGYPIFLFNELSVKKAKDRAQINGQISELLKENNIHISADEKFTLTIDFYHNITVTGNIDSDKAAEIKKVLNDQEYGFLLFNHILNSYLAACPQFTHDEMMKYKANMYLKEYSGYSIDDLIFRDDGVFTNEGNNIQTIINGNFKTNEDLSAEGKSSIKKFINYYLEELQRQGPENISNISLKIEYDIDGLFDYNTAYGFGKNQTAWIDTMLSLRGDMTKTIQYVDECGFTKQPSSSSWTYIALDEAGNRVFSQDFDTKC